MLGNGRETRSSKRDSPGPPPALPGSNKSSQRPANPLIWLGKYLSLALTLPASVFAGYILGAFANHYLHKSWLIAIGIMAGMIAGLIQILRELSREARK